MRARLAMTGAALLAAQAWAGGPAPRAPELAYQVQEGRNLNAFLRDGDVAAHLLLRDGPDPRILVAFPAGNSGVGLWFEHLPTAASWRLEDGPRPVDPRPARGPVAMHGVVAVVSTDAPRLTVKQAVLSNIRFLRDYQAIGRVPPEIAVAPEVGADTLAWRRRRVDGRSAYDLVVRVLAGRIEGQSIVAGPDGRIRLEVRAGSGDTPLHGLSEAELLNDRAAPDPATRRALAFLSYREKFLAGSWRFDTYFGRDTLMSVRLLMPALRPAAIEAGLGAVLARLNEGGEVAHEEGLSEFAILDHQAHGAPAIDAATLDYGMIDDDYMLGPVAADYLLGPAGPAGARAFLARPVASAARPGTAEPAGALLARNLRFVMTQAAPFAARPDARRLVAIKPGRMTGQWRDSEEGIGRGRYPYDVNAVFVPAALDATARLLRAGLLDPYLTPADRAAFARADVMAATWRARAPELFRVTTTDAGSRVGAYAASLGIPAQPALAALGRQPLTFHAISLDEGGRPIPIINSDEGFALLFGQPSPDDLRLYVGALARPFPAGLMTPIGLLVANPALADATVQARFTPAAYHGAVVWSWQQALFAAGLERQLARTDLPPAVRATLTDAQARLWQAIEATRATRSSELWSWAYADGQYRVVPFGAGKADVDESNAAQLWSTVYLAVRPPAGRR